MTPKAVEAIEKANEFHAKSGNALHAIKEAVKLGYAARDVDLLKVGVEGRRGFLYSYNGEPLKSEWEGANDVKVEVIEALPALAAIEQLTFEKNDAQFAQKIWRSNYEEQEKELEKLRDAEKFYLLENETLRAENAVLEQRATEIFNASVVTEKVMTAKLAKAVSQRDYIIDLYAMRTTGKIDKKHEISILNAELETVGKDI